jgi:hypothetical protein
MKCGLYCQKYEKYLNLPVNRIMNQNTKELYLIQFYNNLSFFLHEVSPLVQ